MKKFLAFAISLIAIFACALITACKNENTDVEPIIIKADDESFDFDGKTVFDYMNYLQEQGELTFVADNGMIISINGKSNSGSYYWMLYTDDTENSNNNWGSYELGGTIYKSAALGVTDLKIAKNCTYIWVYLPYTL